MVYEKNKRRKGLKIAIFGPLFLLFRRLHRIVGSKNFLESEIVAKKTVKKQGQKTLFFHLALLGNFIDDIHISDSMLELLMAG